MMERLIGLVICLNPLIIATKAISAEVYVFDRSKHPSEPPPDGACNPDLRLRDHNAEGFGVSWSKFKHGHLLSGSNDAHIFLWDINATPMNKTLQAMQMFKVHEGAVEDVAWHLRHEYYLVLLVMTNTCIYGISVHKQLTSLSNLYLLIKDRVCPESSQQKQTEEDAWKDSRDCF